jgi:Transposase IS116/IS110/IS902 family
LLAAVVDELEPNLVTRNSIGHTGAAQLLLAAGGNPYRLRSEASFAALSVTSPVPASSGETIRHRQTAEAGGCEPTPRRWITSPAASPRGIPSSTIRALKRYLGRPLIQPTVG